MEIRKQKLMMCTCGHEEDDHDDEGFCAECNFNSDLDFEGIEAVFNHKFTPDKLGYLLDKYEGKNAL